MSISGFEYDFNQLLMLSVALLTGSYLLDRWIPSSCSGPTMPFILIISVATGIFKASIRLLGSVAERTGLYRGGRPTRLHGARTTSIPHGIKRNRATKKTEIDGFSRFGGKMLLSIDWMIVLYRGIPLNGLSRMWGKLHQMELPRWLRPHAFRLYIWMYGCCLEDALNEDLYHYRNLSEFFRRSLKPEVRPIHPFCSLSSPVDGQVLYCGRVVAGHMEQVKGVSYTLQGFLGPASWQHKICGGCGVDARCNSGGLPRCSSSHTFKDGLSEDHTFQESIKQKANTDLFHCVIYLAPGDYHRFHSSCDWKVKLRRHFPGTLLSVNPRVAKWVRGLFSLNERAVYCGEWAHGFFSYTAVGATNVGSIRVFCDPKLETNSHRRHRPARTQTSPAQLKSYCKSVSAAKSSRLFYDRVLQAPQDDPSSLDLKKGDLFGEFNFGSTVVLIFEAPKDFRFNVSPQQKVKFGQPLGSLITDFNLPIAPSSYSNISILPDDLPTVTM